MQLAGFFACLAAVLMFFADGWAGAGIFLLLLDLLVYCPANLRVVVSRVGAKSIALKSPAAADAQKGSLRQVRPHLPIESLVLRADRPLLRAIGRSLTGLRWTRTLATGTAIQRDLDANGRRR